MLQICTTPEAYSTLPAGDSGFCFRFARQDDVPKLFDGDPVCTSAAGRSAPYEVDGRVSLQSRMRLRSANSHVSSILTNVSR